MTERDDWLLTASGKRFHVLSPEPEAVCIEDIAHALSRICRFGGHTQRFYSVAQHSVMVSRLVPDRLAMHGLMHDAAEAYCGDVIRPIKKLIGGYAAIEASIEGAIATRFGMRPLDAAEHAEIKFADNVALATERRDLMAPHTWQWVHDERALQPAAEPIIPLSYPVARAQFLDRFAELGGRS